MKRFPPATFFGFCLLFVLNGIAGVSFWRLLWSGNIPPIADIQRLAKPQPESFDAVVAPMPALEAYNQIIARPVFSKSRAPWTPAPISVVPQTVPAAPVQNEPEPDIGMLSLRAVVISPLVRRVFIVTEKKPEGEWFKVDELVEGWRIILIAATSVLLSKGDAKKQLYLFGEAQVGANSNETGFDAK